MASTKEYVLGFDVSMQYLTFVNVLDGATNLRNIGKNDMLRQKSATLSVDFHVEVAAIAVFHHDVK